MPLDDLELLALWDNVVPLDLREKTVHQVDRACLVYLDHLADQVHQDHPDPLDQLDPQDAMESTVPRDLLANQDDLGVMENPDNPDAQEEMENLVFLDLMAKWVQEELLD